MKIPRIEPQELAALIQSKDTSNLMIVDVRDDDFYGGNIKGAVNIPDFDEKKALKLAEEVIAKKKTLVVFHCFYCKMRGPTAAKLFYSIFTQKYSQHKISVKILKGGWCAFKNQYRHDTNLMENLITAYDSEEDEEYFVSSGLTHSTARQLKNDLNNEQQNDD